MGATVEVIVGFEEYALGIVARQRRIMNALREAGVPRTAAELSHAAGCTTQYVRILLKGMVADGLLRQGSKKHHDGHGWRKVQTWEIPDLPERCKRHNHEWYGGQDVCKSCGLVRKRGLDLRRGRR